MLIEKNTKNLCKCINFLVGHFYILQSELIRMARLLALSLLQIENERNECPAIIIIFCKEKTQDTTDKQRYIIAICHKNLFFVRLKLDQLELFWSFEISGE